MEPPDLELFDLLDMEITSVSKDEVIGTVEVTGKHHQPFGYLHGGVSLLLAESVASIGAEAASPNGYHALGMEINANHLRPFREGILEAVAEPVHRGQSTHVWSIEIHDDSNRLICVCRCTLAIQPE